MTRHEFLKATLAGAGQAAVGSVAFAQPVPAQAPGPADTDAQRIADLVAANHILTDHGVIVDGYGHVSARSAANPDRFLMARTTDPSAVQARDILTFNLDSQPIDAPGAAVYIERFIHGEIYRARPDVQSVVHSHSTGVIPFSVTSQPLKAMIHVAYFLGCEPAPVFDLATAAGEDNLMLIDTPKSGAALAKALGSRTVVLMRGHGMAVVGPTIQDAVFRAIYTEVDAKVEADALRLGAPKFMNCHEVTRTEPVGRPWAIWVAEAERRRR